MPSTHEALGSLLGSKRNTRGSINGAQAGGLKELKVLPPPQWIFREEEADEWRGLRSQQPTQTAPVLHSWLFLSCEFKCILSH